MLSLEKLEKVRQAGNKVTARCPACSANGADRGGTHLVYWPGTGKFACSANAGDRPHRQHIWQLAGIPEERRSDYRPSPENVLRRRKEREENRRLEAVAAAAKRQADRIFSMNWSAADLWEESPFILDGEEPDWRLMLEALFQSDAVIWTGEPHHSGPGHGHHFRPVREWLQTDSKTPPFPMICPDTFKAGICSRAAASVTASPFIVVEADEATGRKPATPEEREENIRRNLAVLRWLAHDLDWTLRAVVHTGGKSCHGWFERPPEEHIRELRAIAPALGIDCSVFSPAHPVRLPGVRHKRTGALSRLLYLDGG